MFYTCSFERARGSDWTHEGLSPLCDEFRFLGLSRRLDVFKNTSTYRLEQGFAALKAKVQSMEERMQEHNREIEFLRQNWRGGCGCRNRSSKEFEQKMSQGVAEQQTLTSMLVRSKVKMRIIGKR
jgi:hypothetical protein